MARLARLALVAISLVALAALAGCAGSGGAISVSDAWARPSMGMDRAGAAYLVITNGGEEDDVLLGASSPAAATVEVHETTMDSDGAMVMQPVGSVAIPAGETVRLEPGGYHIMLIELTGELTVGDEIEITLSFERAGEITVSAEVREG
jgi:copper(I)-binding protein